MLKYILVLIVFFNIASCAKVPMPSIVPAESFPQYLKKYKFSGSILVAVNGEVRLNAGYGYANKEAQIRNTPTTPFYISTLTQQFTSTAILQLQEKGKLRLDDRVSKYLPRFPTAKKFTIRQILNHTAGLPDVAAEWEDFKMDSLSPKDLIRLVQNKPLKFKPGSRVEQSNTGYILAGLIIEKVSGMSYSRYIKANIFSRLGMKNSAYAYINNTGKAYGYLDGVELESVNMSIPYASGALISSTMDMYRWDQSFYKNTLLKKASQDQMFLRGRSAKTSAGLDGAGLGWTIDSTPYGPEHSFSGSLDGFASLIARYPKQKAVIIILSNHQNFNVEELKSRLVRAYLKG